MSISIDVISDCIKPKIKSLGEYGYVLDLTIDCDSRALIKLYFKSLEKALNFSEDIRSACELEDLKNG